MELELGLALPNHTPIPSPRSCMMDEGEIDLNNCSHDSIGEENVETGGKAGHDHHHQKRDDFLDDGDGDCQPDIHHEDGNREAVSAHLHLWSSQSDINQDYDRSTKWRKSSHQNMINGSDEESEEMEGWRAQMMTRSSGKKGSALQKGWMGNKEDGGGRKLMHVKVKMEGVGIGRKIDLSLYHSYQTLTNALIHMFANYMSSIDRNMADYTILYQDRDGDWMLAGDVPWEMFVENVQRMQILLM